MGKNKGIFSFFVIFLCYLSDFFVDLLYNLIVELECVKSKGNRETKKGELFNGRSIANTGIFQGF